MALMDSIDETHPDGATEAVSTLDNYAREHRAANKNTWDVEHFQTGEHKFMSGNTADRPAAGKAGRIYINTQTKTIQLDNGTTWEDLILYYPRFKVGTYTGTGAGAAITGVGFAPTYVKVIPVSGSNPSFECGINFGVGDSHKEDDTTTSTTGITSLDSDGFNVGTAASVNTVVYQYIAMRDVP